MTAIGEILESLVLADSRRPVPTRSGHSQWQQKALVARLQFPLKKADNSG